MQGYEVEHDFPGIGHRTMRLNARQVFYEGGAETTILLGIEDITRPRALEREMEDLLRQKESPTTALAGRMASLPGKDQARDQYRQSARTSARGPGGNLGRPKWNDRIGHSRHVFGEDASRMSGVGSQSGSDRLQDELDNERTSASRRSLRRLHLRSRKIELWCDQFCSDAD
jgi:hypothetical protein